MSYRNSPSKEPIIQHDFDHRPWSKIAVDICELHGRHLLIVVDYFSNFIEVVNLTSMTSGCVVKELMIIFSRFGIPDVLISDNATQFSSTEFAEFATKWGFDHSTSSPRYAQSNGKAENAVQTVKRLFNKCRDTGESEFRALLDWRNTPSEGIGSSPAQRLFGRRCKTWLPMARSLLKPSYTTDAASHAITTQKSRQASYYNRSTKRQPAIETGAAIRMKLPGTKTWSPGVCVSKAHGDRSYLVKVGDNTYRRNSRHLLRASTKEKPLDGLESDTASDGADVCKPAEQETDAPNELSRTPPSPIESSDGCGAKTALRRSNRDRKQTDFYRPV